MTTTKEKIAVMQAFEDGKDIIYWDLDDASEQKTLNKKHGECSWSWEFCGYMVKHEPREFWIGFTADYTYHVFTTEPLPDIYEHYKVMHHVREVIDE
jgi:hypothetical protein